MLRRITYDDKILMIPMKEQTLKKKVISSPNITSKIQIIRYNISNEEMKFNFVINQICKRKQNL